MSKDNFGDRMKDYECRKDSEVIDETPGAYKSIDAVMAASMDHDPLPRVHQGSGACGCGGGEVSDKSKYQIQLEALPEWAQKMVLAVSGCASYGGGDSETILCGMIKKNQEKYSVFHVALRKESYMDWMDGFFELRDLAAALSAPYPPKEPTPHDEMTTGNVVEMMTAGDDGCAFDQPCHFGHRVEDHAVYCHNDAWPDSPRKCRRNRTDHKHEDCPGYVPNASIKKHSGPLGGGKGER